MKNIAVLGSTGSIGKNTLEVVRNLNRNGFPVSVKYISANSNAQLLIQQIEEFKPKAAVIFNEAGFNDLKSRSLNHKCEILCGQAGINEIASRDDFELVVNALVGFSGLIPTIEAIKHGKDIALANKESLVVAGELIYSMLRGSSSHLLPIDSEHSAILQCLQGEPLAEVSRLILTASGGPFRELTKEEMNSVTVAQALKHPNWVMGNKITIDSATLMNKGFEIIEAKWLFNIEAENIDVLIHPQSVIHSMVEFSDGSVKAQLGVPDMKVPIQYALTCPGRIKSDFPRIDFKQLKNLTFDEPDLEKFECLKLAYDVIKSGGSYPIVLNGANEAAIDLFLNEKIRFTDIPALIKSAMDKHENHVSPSLENIVSIDSWSRRFVYDSAAELV
ncbi:MAG TPA: 1-deoxy-D-xylulose-5-phosphate reductoisomerase [Ignavibacteria bacterium]|nr:1-deoxy-D-xylulose-5-phosphate reductoisomerase [Ignavibacteria bacterium]